MKKTLKQDHQRSKGTSKQPRSMHEIRQQLEQCQQALNQAKERELKALADYDNLVKRQRQQQDRLNQQAALDLVEQLLSPLNHLALAASHLRDQGIDMVVEEFWRVLGAQGLEEINPQGEVFDESSMEAVEREGSGTTVKQVLKRGYRFKGKLIQPAKVVVG